MSTPVKPADPVVPADFEKAKVERDTASLSPEEIAEFRALRAAKKARDEQVAKDAAEAAAALSPPTHRVHLADGTTVEGSTIATHYVTEKGDLVPVTGAYPLPEFVR